MRQCKITVLKCTLDTDLKERFIPDPDYGPCPYFRPGQVYYCRDGQQPGAFGCRIGWKSIRDEVRAQLDAAGPWPQVVCCNDGCRPVVFLLEAQELL